jgi:signal transduction histidine kinase
MGEMVMMHAYVERRSWHWLDWALFAGFNLWFGLGMSVYWMAPDQYGDPSVWVFMPWAVLCFIIPLVFWRTGFIHTFYFPILILVTYGFLGLYLSYLSDKSLGILIFPSMIAAFVIHKSLHKWFFPIFVILMPSIEFLITSSRDILDFISVVINFIVMYGIGYTLNRTFQANWLMKGLLAENEGQYRLIQEQNRVLEQYAQQVEQLTLLEERNRLAKELHDTVGHTFTSVIMGMDAVAYLMESAPEQAKLKLEKLRRVTRDGLEEVRQNIHQIAPKDMEDLLSLQLSRLSNEFSLHTGTVVSLQVIGEEMNVPKPVKLTLIRCLQE